MHTVYYMYYEFEINEWIHFEFLFVGQIPDCLAGFGCWWPPLGSPASSSSPRPQAEPSAHQFSSPPPYTFFVCFDFDFFFFWLFHTFLPRSSIQMYWISVRFYEMGVMYNVQTTWWAFLVWLCSEFLWCKPWAYLWRFLQLNWSKTLHPSP